VGIHVATPDLALVAWTAAAVALVVLVLVIAYRWRVMGAQRPITPALGASAFVALLTVVWVLPGVVAAAMALLTILGRLLLRSRQRHAPEG